MSSSETEIGNDVNGPALTGSFSGPTQATYIYNQQQPEPPSTIKEQVKSMWLIVSGLEKRQEADAQERQKRQEQADEYRATVQDHLWRIDARVARVEYAMVFLVAALALAGSLIFLVAMK